MKLIELTVFKFNVVFLFVYSLNNLVSFSMYLVKHWVLSLYLHNVHTRTSDTRHTIYVTYKIYLLLKFIEIHKVSGNHFYNDNKSDYHKLQNFKKLQFYWIKDFSMAWVDDWFNFSHAIVTNFFIGSVWKFCGTCGLEESVSLLGLENVYQCLWLPFYWKVHWMKSCFYITVWLC